MKTLHDIRVAALEALIWAYAYGGNGRPIGGNTAAHLYRIERGTPPEPYDPDFDPTRAYTFEQGRRHNARRYWHPWGQPFNDRERILNPACGRLRSTSRWPRIQYASNRWGLPVRCPDCRAIAEGTYIQVLQTEDPWGTLGRLDRITQPDPISGI